MHAIHTKQHKYTYAQKLNLNQHSALRTANIHVYVRIIVCTTVVQNTAQNNSDNPSYAPTIIVAQMMSTGREEGSDHRISIT